LLAGASFVAVLCSVSVLTAPDFSALQPVEAHPVMARLEPAIRLATLRPANSFFNSLLSISTSFIKVN
jgi:hypothetical protein